MGDLLQSTHGARPGWTGRVAAFAGVAGILIGFTVPAAAIDPGALAPPGLCASEERELKRQAPATPIPIAARMLLNPTDVAAPPPTPTMRPSIGSMVGPGPCDSPGSGCQGTVLPAAPATPPPRFIEPEPEPEREPEVR